MKNQQKWYKKLVIAALSVTIGLSAGMASAPHAAEAAVSSTSRANQVISIGKQYLGRPYQFGSKAGQTSTFDCSSFTQYVFKRIGVNLPRSSKQQAHAGYFVPRSQLRAGDLVFFSVPGRPGVINHAAIYIGNGNLLHTYGAGGVRITKLSSGTWSSRYMTARRVL
ncbi:C40 family peptidase [Paenibacillus hexagrammi]|uniref:C40 family peptidase n=1 Tax=Paenibacillus hexagrammi TaxID=2908839 RepID=A0ABY3SI24_9BACL|nr:C40 family peptidase [Paenibacillus sp. YPD9-1]UJF32889.1 C40 family peptidase [Paenibacillus sp. YPD9-1]